MYAVTQCTPSTNCPYVYTYHSTENSLCCWSLGFYIPLHRGKTVLLVPGCTPSHRGVAVMFILRFVHTVHRGDPLLIVPWFLHTITPRRPITVCSLVCTYHYTEECAGIIRPQVCTYCYTKETRYCFSTGLYIPFHRGDAVLLVPRFVHTITPRRPGTVCPQVFRTRLARDGA